MSEVKSCSLGSKEGALYKSLHQFLEFKQYKKGFKISEQILKTCPLHAETLAMKGIFLYHLNKKEEALESIKAGIRQNLKSTLCWNTLGLVYRYERNLIEAAKCYKTALKFDPQNLQMLRDLATIQAQLGTWEQLVETRIALVQLVPTNRTFWIALAVAHRLNGDPEKALKVIDQFELSIREEKEQCENAFLTNELSRISEFKLQLLSETSQWSTGLEYLNQLNLDKERHLRYNALFYLKSFEFHQAHPIYFELLNSFNCNCDEYLCGWIESLPEGSDASVELLGLARQIPTSLHIRMRFLIRCPFDEQFKEELIGFIVPRLRKGTPTCFSLLKPIFFGKSCRDAEDKLRFLDNYLADHHSNEFSYLILQAQLYRKEGAYDAAHKILDTILDLSMLNDRKLTEYHFLKAKLFKNQGMLSDCVASIQQARLLNPKDRYFNSKAVKYLLLNGKIDEALQTMSLFCREEKIENLKEFLDDMQPIWFCASLMHAYRRKGDNQNALEYSCRILGYFDEIYYDPFDFHSYCLRKMTICQYLDLLTVSERLSQCKYFIQALQVASLSWDAGDELADRLANLSLQGSKLVLIQRSISRLPKELLTAEMKLVQELKV